MKVEKIYLPKVFALPGFLGQSGDWSSFSSITNPLALMDEAISFWPWAAQFNDSLPKKEDKKILVGYSMGGRLAMHLLIDNPDQWAGAILISAHPGLKSSKERALRYEADKCWAQRFLEDPWDILMRDWNQNPVFHGSSFPHIRNENEFNRKNLSSQLIHWSLGIQEDLFPRLKKLKIPLLFLAGKKDVKFVEIAKAFASFAQVKIIPNSAHRVCWDNPIMFDQQLKLFINNFDKL